MPQAAALRVAYAEIRRLEHALCDANLLAVMSAAAAPAPEVVIVDKPQLTLTELKTLNLLVAGESVKEIAAETYSSPSTIKSHITQIYHKLGVHNRAGATMTAIRLELVETTPASAPVPEKVIPNSEFIHVRRAS